MSHIHHRGKDVFTQIGDNDEGGPYTRKLKGWMSDIMFGREQHEWGVVVQEEQ